MRKYVVLLTHFPMSKEPSAPPRLVKEELGNVTVDPWNLNRGLGGKVPLVTNNRNDRILNSPIRAVTALRPS